MKLPVKYCVFMSFLLLTQNIHYCDSLFPIILAPVIIPAISSISFTSVISGLTVAAGFVSSIVTIGLWVDSLDCTQDGSNQDYQLSLNNLRSSLEESIVNTVQKNEREQNVEKFLGYLDQLDSHYNFTKHVFSEFKYMKSKPSGMSIRGLKKRLDTEEDTPVKILHLIRVAMEKTDNTSLRHHYEVLDKINYRDPCFKKKDEKIPLPYMLQIFYRIGVAVMQVQYIISSAEEILKFYKKDVDQNVNYANIVLAHERAEIRATFRPLLRKVPRSVLQCDTSNYIEKITYSKMHVRYNLKDTSICKIFPEWNEDNREYFFFTGHYTLADTPDYVVIGARIAEKEGLFYLAIQQGQLLPEGKINVSTISWKEPTSEQLKDPSNKRRIDCVRRYFDLTSAEVPIGHILTGLRFDSVPTKESGRERIRIVLASQSFNFTSGKILVNENMKYTETYPLLAEAKSSLKFQYCEPTPYPNSGSDGTHTIMDKYIEVEETGDKRNLYMGTLPLIDIQSVAPEKPILMGGAGLYLKYNDQCKSYLALRMMSYDPTQRL